MSELLFDLQSLRLALTGEYQLSPTFDPFTATDDELAAWILAGKPSQEQLPGTLKLNLEDQ